MGQDDMASVLGSQLQTT